MSKRSGRAAAAGFLGSAGVVLLLLGIALSFASRSLLDSEFFADRVVASLKDPRTAAYVSDRLTDAVVSANEDLILARPLVRSAAEIVVTSDAFRAVARETVRRSHQLLATEGGREILLSATDFSLILKTALADRPELASRVPDDAVAILGRVEQGWLIAASHETLSIAHRFDMRPRLVFFVGVLFLLLGIMLARETERALLRAGIAVTAVAGTVLVGFEVGAVIVADLPGDPDLGAALAGVWSTFVSGFYPRILILAGVGVMMMAAATAFLEALQLPGIGRNLWNAAAKSPSGRWLRLARAFGFLAVGLAMVIRPDAVLRSIAILSGGLACFVGVRELCRIAVDPSARFVRAGSEPEARRKILRPMAGAIVLVGALIGVALLSPDSPPAGIGTVGSVADSGCNGMSELCDRRLDEVVFAGTHNAMGSADVPGWMFPNQQRNILTQLEDGIRALMLDVLPGIPVGGRVKTDLAEGEISREKLEPALGPEGLDAALRIRERLMGADDRERDLYLCHGLCELGARRLVPALAEIRQFLLVHPNEVIILIIEDAVSPREIARAFEESRLIELVYRGPVSPPWPTLHEMIASHGRVLVLGENHTAGVDWYHPAWEVCQETPYHFSSPEEFSCEPNRGGTTGSLLLMNHWVTTPPTSLPSHAELVNTREALLRRIDECREARNRVPNIIAVDFYRTGDLIEVVAELNRSELAR